MLVLAQSLKSRKADSMVTYNFTFTCFERYFLKKHYIQNEMNFLLPL